MVKITIDDKDLEQMPQEMREMLLEFLIKSKKVDETNITESSDLEPSNKKNNEAAVAIDYEEDGSPIINFSIDTMTLEAAVALCVGLNAETSLKCLEALVDGEELSRKQIADIIGIANEKGVNGLVGSINRRFKGLISDIFEKPNLVYYRQSNQSYYISNANWAPLRFGIWAASKGIDWDNCVSIIWETKYPDTFTRNMNLNIESIKGFLDKSKLGTVETFRGTMETEYGNEYYSCYALSNCGDNGNAFFNDHRGIFCLSNNPSSEIGEGSTGMVWHDWVSNENKIAENFFKSEGIKEDLGGLIYFYSAEEMQVYTFKKALAHISNVSVKKSLGFYWDNFMPRNKDEGFFNRGAFFWFESFYESNVFKAKVFNNSKGSVFYGDGACSWEGFYSDLFEAPVDNYKKKFVYKLRDFFFTDVLCEEPYEGAIKEEHRKLFAKAIEDFRLK